MTAAPAGSLLRRRAVLLGATLPAFGAAQAAADPAAPLIVSSKIDTEGAVLGALLTLRLRRAGIPVRPRLQLGPTFILRQALLSGAIDLYPEYTGNAATFFHAEGQPRWHDPDAAWRAARDLDAPGGIVWLPPAPAENGWGIAVRPELARAGVRSLADLPGYLRGGGRLRLAASVEFLESPDALPAFERAYGFRLSQDQVLMLAGGNTAATLRAAAQATGGVNAAMAYGTDGALDVLGLSLLADPARAEISFRPAPVVRRAALAAHTRAAAALTEAFTGLDAPALRRLNAAVAVEGAAPFEVAEDWLGRHAPA